ncbi:MAG TPA: Holliday junction branch migration protein RuvA [Candidatus Paceibacterota bacterium]|nr:Holliday junction branch migration protein RuvA [Candidatus Paceibacterota bacterium]
MIRQLSGTVVAESPAGVVVEVIGVGFAVTMPAGARPKAGAEARLATHLAFSQSGLELYGFLEAADRDFFELLLRAPGVGPKTALGILAKAPREMLAGAIARKDLDYLTRIAGLGKKSAEKLAVMLAEKMPAAVGAAGPGADGEILDTLIALGYSEREARKALAKVPAGLAGKEARLRAALAAG